MMKLRILDNSLRFRLSQSEVAQLADGQAVHASTQFPGSARLGYELLIVSDLRNWDAQFNDNLVSVRIPAADGQRLTDTDEITLATQLSVGDGNSLAIKVEKDFHCLTPRDGEDESELYSHPEAGSSAPKC